MMRQCLDNVLVDTTVQPSAIAHFTDSRLLNRAQEQLVATAQEAGNERPQSYARVGGAADAQSGRSAHARRSRRKRSAVKKLRTWLGCVIRTVQRMAGELGSVLKIRVQTAQRLHAQKRDSKNKLEARPSPDVACIAKGGARTPYEIGVMTSGALKAKEGVVGMRSMSWSPYDGHTLHSQPEQVEILTGVKHSMALPARGYRGVRRAQGIVAAE